MSSIDSQQTQENFTKWEIDDQKTDHIDLKAGNLVIKTVACKVLNIQEEDKDKNWMEKVGLASRVMIHNSKGEEKTVRIMNYKFGALFGVRGMRAHIKETLEKDSDFFKKNEGFFTDLDKELKSHENYNLNDIAEIFSLLASNEFKAKAYGASEAEKKGPGEDITLAVKGRWGSAVKWCNRKKDPLECTLHSLGVAKLYAPLTFFYNLSNDTLSLSPGDKKLPEGGMLSRNDSKNQTNSPLNVDGNSALANGADDKV